MQSNYLIFGEWGYADLKIKFLCFFFFLRKTFECTSARNMYEPTFYKLFVSLKPCPTFSVDIIYILFWQLVATMFFIFIWSDHMRQDLYFVGWDFVCIFNSFTPWSKFTFSQPSKKKCMSGVVRICTIIILHLSKLWIPKFFILCDVIFLVRLQGKVDIDHS